MNRLATLLISLRTLLTATLAVAPAAQAQTPADPDDAAWAAAVEAGSAEAYQQYLEEFPAGRHLEEAFRRLIESQLEIDPAIGPGLGVY